ncbi:hypothetical protein AMTRI_Chr12g269840 [Amborella trichopoda]
MWQKVYCRRAYLYYRSACLYCRSDLFNHRSNVAPEGVLSECVFVLPEHVSSLPEQPIQPSKRFGSRRYTAELSPCNAETRVFIVEVFKWTAGVHGERIMVKTMRRERGSLIFFFSFVLNWVVLLKKIVVGKKSKERLALGRGGGISYINSIFEGVL